MQLARSFTSPNLLLATFADAVVGDDPLASSYALSKDGGLTWTGSVLCTDRQAGVLYIAYQAFSTDKLKSVMFTRSTDRGASWSVPVRINDTPAHWDVFSPAIAVSPDGQHVTVEFYDQRNQTASSAGNDVDSYLAESFDGGSTWEPNIRLSDFSSDLRIAVKRAGGGLNAVLNEAQSIVPSLNFQIPAVASWIDTRAGNNDPYSVRIQRTQGASFEAWRHLRFGTNDLARPDVSGELADPDGDGIPNLLEFVLGSEPNHPDSSPFKVSFKNSGPTSRLVVMFQRLAVLSGVGVTWESSSDLIHWTPAEPVEVFERTGHEAWLQEVEADFQPSALKQFFRLRATSQLSGG